MATLRHHIAASLSGRPLLDLAMPRVAWPVGRRLGAQAGLAASVEMI